MILSQFYEMDSGTSHLENHQQDGSLTAVGLKRKKRKEGRQIIGFSCPLRGSFDKILTGKFRKGSQVPGSGFKVKDRGGMSRTTSMSRFKAVLA